MLRLSLEMVSNFLNIGAGDHLSVAMVDSAGLFSSQHIGATTMVNTGFVGIIPGPLVYHQNPRHHPLGDLGTGYDSSQPVINLYSIAMINSPTLGILGIDPHFGQAITIEAGLKGIHPKTSTIISGISPYIKLVQFS